MNEFKKDFLVIFQSGCGDGTLVRKYESISNTKGVVPEERLNRELHESQQTTAGDTQASGLLDTYKLSLSSPRNMRETFRQVHRKHSKRPAKPYTFYNACLPYTNNV
jgi:hypothetical protein